MCKVALLDSRTTGLGPSLSMVVKCAFQLLCKFQRHVIRAIFNHANTFSF